jgi:2-iminoacetate synthase
LGFRSLLLVAGEHPKFVSEGYLEECIKAIRDLIPSIALEVGPMETPEYSKMVNAGCETLVVYQETYDRNTYTKLHTSGPKKDFNWRLECPERAYRGGFRRIGIGALFGLSEWRNEALALASHLAYLQQNCWKVNYTVSFPRIRPAAGGFNPNHNLTDKDFLQLIFAFRITFPEVGIILSTRESKPLRDNLSKLGITSMSAGSHTEPGGYTGEGVDDLHYTVRGRRVDVDNKNDSESLCSAQLATEQFEINDDRSPNQICEMLIENGLDPVWKDWEQSILCTN